ncbi:MAG: alanine dehydrogenase [Candidatus Eisenbacteria bacterium]|nr:alanine dehydrogenase [Candidatus Eisenbacteria bacterium]
MDFGVPLERHRTEHRVGLIPRGARILVDLGHRVFVETGAGEASRFPDAAYREAGAEVVFRREEVYRRCEVVLGVNAPTMEEIGLTSEGQTLLAFWHLAVAPKPVVAEMNTRRLSAIGFEAIEADDGDRPVLRSMSELAGQMTIHTAAHLLQRESGGRGILLGASPGIAPATIVILGAGTVGQTAAESAVGSGAQVIVLDQDLEKLRALHQEYGGRVVTGVADRNTIAHYVQIADVLIGAVLVPSTGHAPYLVTRDMVATMRAGSVIIDLSIDQGGCVETSRPTTIDDPTFVFADVVHYCVPNMTADIPRTASKALTNAHAPFLEAIARLGLDEALRANPSLARGTYMYRGTVTHEAVASQFGLEYRPIGSLVGGEGRF